MIGIFLRSLNLSLQYQARLRGKEKRTVTHLRSAQSDLPAKRNSD